MSYSAEEDVVVTIIGELLGEAPKRQHTFPWLKTNAKRNLFVDAYFPESALVVEYDGRQHREFVPWYHRDIRAFERAQERDSLKNRLLAEHGIRLVRITDQEPRTANHLSNRLNPMVVQLPLI